MDYALLAVGGWIWACIGWFGFAVSAARARKLKAKINSLVAAGADGEGR